jgi:hypothetical protein
MSAPNNKHEGDICCDYCGEKAKLVTGKEIYPHRPDLYKKDFWSCEPCDAYVGCHPKTIDPLGRLAKADLRSAKSAAHRAFDPLWRGDNKQFSRSKAYNWLANELGIPKDECHIGWFDLAMCQKVEQVSNEFFEQLDSDDTMTLR